MSDTSGSSPRDHRDSAEVMAGLEIVDTDPRGLTPVPDEPADQDVDSSPGDESQLPPHDAAIATAYGFVSRDDAPAADVQPPPGPPLAERALSPIQRMWNGTGPEAPPHRRPQLRPLPKEPRSAKVALPMVVVLALIAAFIAWVSAEPFWLSVGHDIEGTVTVNECEAAGFAPRCEGEFVPEQGSVKLPGVRITGDAQAKQSGETIAAQAVSLSSGTVYVGDQLGLVLRWGIGLVLLLVCGLCIAWVTGAWRWHGRARTVTVLVSLAGPVLLWFGALAFSW
jgi:hypothetical protein